MARKVEVLLVGDSRSAQRAFDQLTAAQTKALTKLEASGRQMAATGKTLSRNLTVPILAVGAAAAKTFIDFESSFAGVRKTVDASEAEFAQLSQQFRDLALEIPLSVNEINRIGEAAGQLGIEKENILAFTRTMADLGVATNLTSEEAATAFARFANITGMPQTEFDRLGATVVALGNNLATTESEISEFGLRIAGAGAQVGLTEAEILGLGGALSSVGINAEAGGTAISKVMINMASAVSAGGEELDNFATVAGMSADEFATAFRDRPAEAITTFVEGLGRVDAQGGDLFATLEQLGITEQRMRDAMLRTAGAGTLVADAMGLANDAFGENTALTDEAAQRYGTLESKLTLAKNALYDAGITAGEVLAPKLVTLAEAAAGTVEAFASMPEPVQNTVMGLAAVAAAAGPTMFVAGKLTQTWGKLQKTMAAANAFKVAGTGVEAIGASAVASSRGLTVLSAIFSPAGALTVGLAAVAAGAYLVKRNIDQMKEAHASAAEGAEDLADSLGIAYRSIEQAAEEAGEATEHAFAQANAAAIKSIRDLTSAADQADYLFEVGYQLVQHGASPEEALEAIRKLAAEAGIEVPVEIDAMSLMSFERHLEAVGGTAERVAREIEANWLGMGTATKETMSGVAQSAAEAFRMGEAENAIAILAEFEASMRSSSLSTTMQNEAINFLNDEFLKLTEVGGLSIDSTRDLDDAMRELSSDVSTASRESKELAAAYLEARDAGLDQAAALERAREETVNVTRANEASTDRLQGLADAHKGAGRAADDQTAAEGDLEGQVDDSAEATEEYVSALEALADTHRAALDPVFGLQRAIRDAEDAQEDYTAAVKEHGEGSDEAVAAYERLIDAGLDTQGALGELQSKVEDGTVSVGQMREAVQRLVDMGLLPPELFDQAVGDLEGFILRAERGGFEIGTGIGDGTVAGINARAQTIAEQAARMVDNALRSAKARAGIESPSKKFAKEVGEPISEGVAVGIEDGGSLVNQALDKVLDEARERAADGVAAIAGGISSAAGRARAQDALAAAEAEVRDAEWRQKSIVDEIRSVRDDIRREGRRGREVTLEEEEAILRAEQRHAQAEERLLTLREEGAGATELRLAEIELARAEEELTRVREQAIGPTRELGDLNDRLEKLLTEQQDLPGRLAAAQRDLTAAQLDAIEAEKRLLEAGADLIAQGPEGEEMFRNLATAAGIEEAAIDRLIQKYRELAAARAGTPDAAGITRPKGAAAVTAVSPKLADALRAVGHDAGTRVDPADIAAGLARIGHDYGSTIDPSDVEVLLRRAAKMHTGGIVAGPAGSAPWLRPDERHRTLQLGEEVLPPSDPRHRANQSPGGDGPTQVVIPISLDGKLIAEHVVDLTGLNDVRRQRRRRSA